MSLASKEAREARYWLKLIEASELLKGRELDELITESTEIIRMLTKIVKTTQNEIK